MKTNKNIFMLTVFALLFFFTGKVTAQTDSTALNQLHKIKSGNNIGNNAGSNPKTAKLQAANGKQGSINAGNGTTSAPLDTTSVTPAIILTNKKN